jgi:Ig-like domain-containing protein/VCBS repeat protein
MSLLFYAASPIPAVTNLYILLRNNVLRAVSKPFLSLMLSGALLLPVTALADTIPVITQQPLSASLTVGNALSLSVTATGANSFTYQWYKDGVALFGQTSSYYGHAVQPADAGQYTVDVTDSAGSTLSAAAIVTVPTLAPPTPSTTKRAIQRVALGSELSVSSSYYSYGGQPAVIQWYKDGQPIAGANSTQYSIQSAQYSDSGAYVEVDGFFGGSVSQVPWQIEVTNPTNSNIWIDCGAQAGIAYFLFASPAEVLRYDMNTGAWLSPVTLSQSSAPTAMEVLPEGVYIACGRTTYLYSLDLSTSAALANTDVSTFHIFSNPTYVYLVGSGQYGSVDITAVNRNTGASGLPSDLNSEVYGGIEVSAATGLAYGWSYSDASSLYPLVLNSDGSVSGYTGPQLSQLSIPSYTGADVIFTPDGSGIVTGSGDIYATATFNLVGSFGLQFDDLSFLADGTAVALRGNKLTLYSANIYVEQGRVLVPAGAQRVFGNGSNVFAFSAPSGQGGAVTASKVTESQLEAGTRVPLSSLSASASADVAIAPDDAFIGTDGNAYLLSRPTGNILRWSPTLGAYLTSIPLTGIPQGFSYSSALNRIYVFYADQRITCIDLGYSLAEIPFATAAGNIDCILAADNQLYTINDGTYWGTATLYSSGAVITAQSQSIYGDDDPDWNSALQDIEGFVESGLAELQYFTIQGGTFGTPTNSTFLTPAPVHPFRFSSDGSLFVAMDGVIYNSTTFAQAGVLGNSPVDATWIGSNVYSITSSASGTELDIWDAPNYLSVGSKQIVGAPLRIWSLSSGGLLVLTEQARGPVFTTLDASGHQTSQYANVGAPFQPTEITAEPANETVTPGGSALFSLTATGTNLTYSWVDTTTGATVGTGSSLGFANVSEANAGVYNVTVTGLGDMSATEQFELFVSIPPEMILGPAGLDLPTGNTGVLETNTISFPQATYQWYLNGSPISNATSYYLYVGTLSGETGAGSYTVTATNPFGSVTSAPAVVKIGAYVAVAPAITAQPVSRSAEPGDSATFSVTATGDPAPTYQWNLNGSAIAGAISRTLTIFPVQDSSAGTYSVTVSNQVTAATSNGATLSLAGLPFDINGDGMPDIFWTNTSTNDRGAYLMNGTSISGWADLGTIPSQWRIGAVADFTGSGHDDILWQNTSTGECGFYIMNGTTVTGWVELGTIPTQWRIAAAADFLGNGNVDILWQNTSTGDCGIYLMNGTTVTGWKDLGTVPTAWRIAAAADFSGNGSKDILWQNMSTGECGFYLMSGTTVTGWAELGTVPAGWRAVEAADFSNSGHPDIVWQNTTTGDCGLYMMNGTSITGWVPLGTVPTTWRILP